MSLLSMIVAGCFAITGLLLCAIILRIFYEALAGPQKGWTERWKVRQRERQLLVADQFLEKGELSSSFKHLRQGLFFDVLKHDSDLIERVSSLHFEILNKLIHLSNSRDLHIPELVVLEDLFSSRTSLLRSWGEVISNRNNLLRKRQNKMPEWAFDEYQKKLSEFSDQLNTNRKSIESQIERVFSALLAPSSAVEDKEEIIYH